MLSKIKYKEIEEYINGENGNGCSLLLNELEFNNELKKQNKSNTKIKMKIKCRCGEIFKTTFDKFKNQNKKQCNKCGLQIKRNQFSKTQEQFEKELFEIVENEYTVLGNYINTDTSLNIRHNSKQCDNYIWNVRPANILRGDRCPICSHIKIGVNQRKTDKQFKNEVKELTNDEFEVIGKYTRAYDLIEVKHNICGNTFFVVARDMLRDRGCPICGESKGEKRIRRMLEQYSINYDSQYSFDDLVGDGNRLLRFDFAIFDKDNNLSFLCEYDGEFHYKKIYAEHDFEGQVHRDGLKNKYCETNKIDLLRIPYWDFENIETILTNKLKENEVYSEQQVNFLVN
jgi:hypothetical protein